LTGLCSGCAAPGLAPAGKQDRQTGRAGGQ